MKQQTEKPTPTLSEGARITLALTFNAIHKRFLAKGLHNKRGYLRLADRLASENRFRLRKLQHQNPDLTNTMNQGIDYWADVLRIIIEANDLLIGLTNKQALPESMENTLPWAIRPVIKGKANSLIDRSDPDGFSLRRAMKAPVTDDDARDLVHGHFMQHTFETNGPLLADLLTHEMLSYEARVMLADLNEQVQRYQQDSEAQGPEILHRVGGALLYVDLLKRLLDANREAPDCEYARGEGEVVEWTLLASLGSRLYTRELELLGEEISGT